MSGREYRALRQPFDEIMKGNSKKQSTFLIGAVQRYVNGKESARAVAMAFSISHCYLLSLVNQYEYNGVYLVRALQIKEPKTYLCHLKAFIIYPK